MKLKKEQTDEELVVRYQSGEEHPAEELIERYKQLVRARARTLYLAGGDQDDLLQEGMIGLFKAIQNYRAEKEPHVPFQAYAALCIERQMFTAIATSQRQKNQPLNTSVSLDSFAPEVIDSQMGSGRSPESLLLDEETVHSALEQIRALLSGYENNVLDLYLQGLNYHEIAETLGKSPKSVDNALNRMKKKVSVLYQNENRSN